ncbi:MAG: hypothetical protein GY856_14840 [bacterium]|nr:hypothetical protein [bacterium]
MEIITSIATNVPMFLACVLLAIAAGLKLGKEKGSILILLGAIGLILLTCASPIVYVVIMPKVIEGMDLNAEHVSNVYSAIGLASNLFWAGAIALIAVGTFLRPTVVRQP